MLVRPKVLVTSKKRLARFSTQSSRSRRIFHWKSRAFSHWVTTISARSISRSARPRRLKNRPVHEKESQTMSETKSIEKRCEFVFLYDVVHGNPNGDPDAG